MNKSHKASTGIDSQKGTIGDNGYHSIYGGLMMRKFIVLTCVMLILSTASTVVFADDDLRINKMIIKTALLQNGDLKISQDITYEFDDEYNGVYWNIGLKDTDGIRDVKVYELINGSEAAYIEHRQSQAKVTMVYLNPPRQMIM